MKKLLPLFILFFSYPAFSQVNVYWREEAGNGNWENGAGCEWYDTDGNWYYGDGWGGNRRRPDCWANHYVHFSNNNQTSMNLNSGDDFAMNKLFFDPAATVVRTIYSDAGKKIFFKGSSPKLENHSTANHIINVQISLESDTEISPIDGNLTLTGSINTFGHNLTIWGDNGKALFIDGVINGGGSLAVNQNSVVLLSGNNTYTGNTTVNAGTLQLNNNSGALPATASVTAQSWGTLKVSKNQTLANVTINSGASLVIDSGAVLTVTGTLTNNGTIVNNGTLVLQPSADTTFPGNSGNITAMKALTINAVGTVTLDKNISPESLSVTSGTLNLGTFTANGTGGNLILSGNAILKINGTNTLPSGYSVHSFGTTSTVSYIGAIQSVSALGAGEKYGDLELGGSGSKTLSGNVIVANNLTLQSGASLLVSTGKTLTVDNQLVNNAATTNFVIEDNAALVQTNNVANTGGILQYKNSNSLYRLDYTLWASPVMAQNLYDFSPATSTNRFYEYKYAQNSSNNWVEGYWSVSPSATSFEAGKGYLIRMPNSLNDVAGYNNGETAVPYIAAFTGEPHNGNITIPLSMAHNRFTAVGNPYPSPISVHEFFEQNSSVLDQSGAIYLWRKKNDAATSSYATLTKAAYTANGSGTNTAQGTGGQGAAGFFTGTASNWTIAPAQGFIIQTSSTAPANPVLTFTNSMRKGMPATGTQAFLKSGQEQASRLWLNLTDANGGFSQMAVAYLPEGTTGLDYGYDGKRLSTDNSLSLYTLAQETPLAIQARPDFEAADVVTTGFTAPIAGTYNISLDHTDGVFANGQEIYLKDKTEGITRNLGNGAYTFTSEAGTFNDRFEIVYTTTALGTDAPTAIANTVIIYKNNNALNIHAEAGLIEAVTIYDIAGRKLYSASAINTPKVIISSLVPAQQVLITEVKTTSGTVTKKIVY